MCQRQSFRYLGAPENVYQIGTYCVENTHRNFLALKATADGGFDVAGDVQKMSGSWCAVPPKREQIA